MDRQQRVASIVIFFAMEMIHKMGRDLTLFTGLALGFSLASFDCRIT